MGGRYKIDCLEWNPQHVRFNVFDPFGANCGVLTILAKDVKNFVTNGRVTSSGTERCLKIL